MAQSVPGISIEQEDGHSEILQNPSEVMLHAPANQADPSPCLNRDTRDTDTPQNNAENSGDQERRLGLKNIAFFYSTVCAVCDDPCILENGLSTLKTCGKCHLVSYCGPDHQREHWKFHKETCLVLKAVLKKLGANKIRGYRINDDFEERNDMFAESAFGFNTYRYYLYFNVKKKIGRPLCMAESRMILFPRMCNICYSNDVKQLKVCTSCLCVSYCSEDHKEKDRERHSKDCPGLKVCFEVDKSLLEATGFADTLLSDPVPFSVRGTSYLDMIKSLSDHFLRNLDTIEGRLLSNMMSAPLTIVQMVHLFDLSRKQRLSVEIVGAGSFEMSYFQKWEVLLHWLPDVEKVFLTFVGPEVGGFDPTLQLCDDCVSRIDVEIVCSTEYYHDFVNVQSSPDLIVAFNAGFTENIQSKIKDTWKQSIPYLLKRGCHVLVTSYTREESENDLARVQELVKNSEVIMHCQKNIFSSKKPLQNWEVYEDETLSQVYYNNYYQFVVRAKQCEYGVE